MNGGQQSVGKIDKSFRFIFDEIVKLSGKQIVHVRFNIALYFFFRITNQLLKLFPEIICRVFISGCLFGSGCRLLSLFFEILSLRKKQVGRDGEHECQHDKHNERDVECLCYGVTACTHRVSHSLKALGPDD